MKKIGDEVFQFFFIVIDKFHAKQLINDAIQEIRIK
ncbi:MAG: hypothetical protein IMY72_06875 [Bacteroidetes bacterium]|nr:hypothetical protein [Bacteroidota bacterium]